MYKLKHHDFFKVFLPKNRDPENMDAGEMLMEETALFYGDQITTNYELDDSGKTLLDIDITPTHIYMSWYFNKNDVNAQFRALNKSIDRIFTKKLLQVDPVYRCTILFDYHFHYYNGDVDIFFKHIKYEIIPLSSIMIEELKKENDGNRKIPDFEILNRVILEWIESKTPKEKSKTIFQKSKSLNWIQYIGLLVTFAGVLIASIVERKNLVEFFKQFFP